MQEMLFESDCNCGFARGRKTREPDGRAALFAQFITLVTREGGVPCNVANSCVSVILKCDGGVVHGGVFSPCMQRDLRCHLV